MDVSNRKAVVVGAGVAGLATAIGLRRQGWDVEVLERAERVSVLGTALGIWPGAQDALERLGLGGVVQGPGMRSPEGWLRRQDGTVLARIPTTVGRGRSVVLVSRSELLQLLLAQLPDGVVRTGYPVTAPRDLPGADLVVAADGVGSAVRTMALGGRARPVHSGLLAFRGIVPGEFSPYGEVWGHGAVFGVTPLTPGYTNWFAALPAPADSAFDWDDLHRLMAGWTDPVPAVLSAVDSQHALRHPIVDLRPSLRTTVAGNVVVIGDAAHAMTPHLGQGACQAILDADALTDAVRVSPDVPSALVLYDRRRRRPGRRVAAGSRLLGRVAHATTAAPVRDAVVRMIGSAAASSPVVVR